MSKGLEVALDELEAFIQLIQLDRPELKKATCEDLANAIRKEFGVEVNEHDIYVLYEPTIEEIELADRTYYGAMFDWGREIY